MFISVRGLNTACEVVKFCQENPMFREVNMKRYIAATTTRRTFNHVTCEEIESRENLTLFKSRAAATYKGKILNSINYFNCITL